MTRFSIPALTLALFALAASPAAAQTTLRYQFKEGETLNYAMDQKMKMTTSVMGKNIDMNMDQTANMTWKIDSVDSEGNAKITITFGRMKMSMDSPMGKVEVDSQDADGPDDPLGKVLFGVVKAMAGMTVSGKINPRGEISDVQVPEKAAKQLGNLPGADALGDMFSPEGLKRMMGQSGLVLPKEAVKKGEKWDHKMDMKLPFGKINAEFNYVYDGPTEKGGRTLEKIALKPKMTIDPDPNAPFAMKMKSQEGGGHALFDNKTGKLNEVTINQTMEMEIDVMGQTLSQRMVQNVTTRLVDKK
jgi:hypothetical protein